MSGNIIELNDVTFEKKALQSDMPVLVDFWAPWCDPCVAILPILDSMANKYGESIRITKVNVDDNPVTLQKYGVQAIPTIVILKNGEVAEQMTGMVAKEQLEDSIKAIV